MSTSNLRDCCFEPCASAVLLLMKPPSAQRRLYFSDTSRLCNMCSLLDMPFKCSASSHADPHYHETRQHAVMLAERGTVQALYAAVRALFANNAHSKLLAIRTWSIPTESQPDTTSPIRSEFVLDTLQPLISQHHWRGSALGLSHFARSNAPLLT